MRKKLQSHLRISVDRRRVIDSVKAVVLSAFFSLCFLVRTYGCGTCSEEEVSTVFGFWNGDEAWLQGSMNINSNSYDISGPGFVSLPGESIKYVESSFSSQGFVVGARSTPVYVGSNYLGVKIPCGVKSVEVNGVKVDLPKRGSPPEVRVLAQEYNIGPPSYYLYKQFSVGFSGFDTGPLKDGPLLEIFHQELNPEDSNFTVAGRFFVRFLSDDEDDLDPAETGSDPISGTSQTASGDVAAKIGSNFLTAADGEGNPSGVLNWNPETIVDATDIGSVSFSSFSGTTQMVTSSTNTNLKQVYAVGGVTNVVSTGTQLRIALYEAGNVGSLGGDGLYTVSGIPAKEMVISGTGATVSYEVYMAGTLTSDFTLEQPAAGSIMRINNATGKKEALVTNNSGGEHSVTREIWDVNQSPDQVLKKSVVVTGSFAFGPRTLREIEDPDGEARTTSYTYQEDEEGNGYGKVQSITYPDNSWIRYDYDDFEEGARIVAEYSPWKSFPATAAAWSATTGKVITRSYGEDQQLESETTTIEGVQTNCEEYVYTSGTDSITEAELDVTIHTSKPAGGPQTERITRRFYDGHKLHSIDYEDGRRDSYSYDKGLYVSGTFTPDSGGEFERTIVTHGTTEDPEGIANKTTREITIEDAAGRTVFEETQVYTNEEEYERITLILHTYDGNGNLTQTTENGRVTYSATYFSDGKVDTETDEQGIETAYTYEGENIATVTKKGVAAATIEGVAYAAQPDIVTIYEYDLLGRQVSEVVTSGTMSLPERTTTYTVAGDIATQTEGGLTTTYTYASGGRITTVTRPNGATEITENYLDGQTKSITGTGVVHRFFDYGVHFEQEGEGYADGTLWTETHIADGGSPRWEKITTDGSGAKTLKIEKPTFDGTGLNTAEFVYNTKGQLIKEERTGYADRLYEYDELGRQFREGLDMNDTGSLDLASADRINETEKIYSKDEDDGSWSIVSRSIGYLADLDGTPTILSSRSDLVSELDSPSILSITALEEVPGKWGTEVARILRDDKVLENLAYMSTSSVGATSVVRNGLLQSQNSAEVEAPAQFTYDDFGRQIGRTNPRTDLVTATTYSATTGQILSVATGTSGPSTSYEYYPAGSGANTGKLKKTTENGRSTYFAWTLRGELYRQWGAAYPAEFSYDEFGQLATMKTYRGGTGWQSATWPGSPGSADTTTWIYKEATGQLAGKRDAEDEGVDYTWNDAGQLAGTTRARGTAITYGYNLAGELTSKTYSDATPPVSFVYNRRGLPASITDGGGVRARTYTLDGQLDSETYVSGVLPAGWVLDHGFGSYHETGKVTSVSLAGLTPVYSGSFSYATNGVLSQTVNVGSPLGSLVNFTPLSNSTMVGALEWLTGSSHFQVDLEADEFDRRTGTSTDWVAGPWPYEGSTRHFDSFGQFSKIFFNGVDSYWDLTYNDRGELHEATRYYTSGPLSPYDYYQWLYDNQGNREEFSTGPLDWKDYTPNTLNQYSQIETEAVTENFQYDPDGNLTQDATWDYTWDAENRLVSMQTSALAITGGAPAKKLVFAYDSQNRRVSKTVLTLSGTTYTNVASHKVFAYDGWRPIAEIGFSGTVPIVEKTYHWGLDLAGWNDGRSTENAGGIGGLWMIQSGTNGYYPVCDVTGTVLALVDAGTSEKVATYRYDPWGNQITVSGTAAAQNPFRFQSQYYDDETGLFYWTNRYYSPEAGRWLNRDPIGEFGAINLFSFVANSPVNQIDVLGLAPTAPAPVAPTAPTPFPPGSFDGPPLPVSRGIGWGIPWPILSPIPALNYNRIPTPRWSNDLVTSMYRSTGKQAQNACQKLALQDPGENQYFYSNVSIGRATGAAAVLWKRKVGQFGKIDPPGWRAADAFRPGTVHRGHLIPNRYGGNGNYENIVTQDWNFNLSQIKVRFENKIDRKLKETSSCFVCIFNVPAYAGVGTTGVFNSGKPVPAGFATAIITGNSYSGDSIVQPVIFGNPANDIVPWNWYTGPDIPLN